MSLHGTIEVNARPILRWGAQRIDTRNGIYHYDCRVFDIERGSSIGFEVSHDPHEGAAILTARVMTEYYRIRRNEENE